MYARRAVAASRPAPLFKRNFALADLGADATFTRASTAYVTDYQGVLRGVPINIPRFAGARWTGSEWSALTPEGSPITGIQYLNEPGSTNQVPYSFEPSTWTHSFATTDVPAGLSPLWSPVRALTKAGNSRAFTKTLTLVTATTYCFSIYCEIAPSNAHDFVFGLYANSSWAEYGLAKINKSTLAISWQIAPTVTNDKTLRVENLGTGPNGGALLRATLVFVSGTTAVGIYVYSMGLDLTLDGGAHVLHGAQIEASAFPTTPIMTTASPVSRAADGLSYSGIPADNETRIVVAGANSDTDDWDGVVDETGRISSIRVYAPGDRP